MPTLLSSHHQGEPLHSPHPLHIRPFCVPASVDDLLGGPRPEIHSHHQASCGVTVPQQHPTGLVMSRTHPPPVFVLISKFKIRVLTWRVIKSSHLSITTLVLVEGRWLHEPKNTVQRITFGRGLGGCAGY